MNKFLLFFSFIFSLGLFAETSVVASEESSERPATEVSVGSIVQFKKYTAQFNVPVKVVESYIGSVIGVSVIYVSVGGLEEETATWRLPKNFSDIESIRFKAIDDSNVSIVTVVGFLPIISEEGILTGQEKVSVDAKIKLSKSNDLVSINPELVLEVTKPQ